MKKGLKKIFNGLWKFSKFCIKWVVIVAVIGTIINSVGGLLSKRAEKKQEAAKNNTTVTSVDNTNKDKIQQNKVEESKKETQVVITENKDEKLSDKQQELAKKQELEKSYSYVSGPIVRNGKKYWKVRTQGVPSAGWVDYETNIEVIKPGTYDYIGNEIEIAGISYVQVSIPYDDGCAYGLLNLNNFIEVIPCGFYRDVDILENKVECLQQDRETTDVYQPDENSKVLTKKQSYKVQ